jgi:hypothetical protein
MKKIASICGAIICLASEIHSQSAFQNLDFESAHNLPATPSGPVYAPTTNALPGWTVSDAGGNPETQVFYNGVSVGTALVTLVGTNPFGSQPALDGNYSATLDAGQNSTGFGSAAIYQTGIIPGIARSLTFEAAYDVAALQLSVGGQNVPFYVIGISPAFSTYGADISAFAGLNEQIEFTETSTPSDRFGTVYLDGITFSPNSIPEPQTWALMFCGAAGWFLMRRRK